MMRYLLLALLFLLASSGEQIFAQQAVATTFKSGKSQTGKKLKRYAKKRKRKTKKQRRSTTAPIHTTSPKKRVKKRATRRSRKVINEANLHVGVPYRLGGESTRGFDCSGFTQYVFDRNGINLLRTASAQSTQGKKIPINQARKGDLVFFSNGRRISYVGIVNSNAGEPLIMIHAGASTGVTKTNIHTSN